MVTPMLVSFDRYGDQRKPGQAMGRADKLDLARIADIVSQIERGSDDRRDVRLQDGIFGGMPRCRVSLGGTAEHDGTHYVGNPLPRMHALT